MSTPTVQRVATPPASATLFPNGTIIQKRFADGQFHEGEDISFDTVNQYYKINYRDGNSEEFDQQHLPCHLKRT